MSDQIGLFDAPQPEPPPPPPARGRTRETFVRSVTVEVTVVDGEALRTGARDALDNTVVIEVPYADGGEPDVEHEEDPPDPVEGIDADPATALEWRLEPFAGLATVLETGAVHLEDLTLEVTEQGPDQYRARWSVRLKLRDAPLLRELAREMCADDEASRAAVDRSVAAAWERVADPFAPLAAVPGVRWAAGEVTVEQVFARARSSMGRTGGGTVRR